jgi:hypothetical protein
MIQKQTYEVNEILRKPMPEVEVIEFNREKQSLVIYRTKKGNISDPYIFYIQGVVKRHPDLDIQSFINKDSIAKPITKQELLTFIKTSISKLKESYKFELHGNFIDAIEFEEEAVEETFLCETTEEIVFFNWMETN